jgi:hypothetical protein
MAAAVPAGEPALLVLDVDHTLLQGITAEHYAWYSPSRYCAKFTYRPSASRYRKYLARMRDESSARMIHYTLPEPDDGQSMEFYVSIRPCLAKIMSHPRIVSGEVPVLLASANEDERTEAILDKLPMFEGQKTMPEHLGKCRFIPRAAFLDDYQTTRSGKKRIGDIRAWAERQNLLPEGGKLVFLDDKVPGNIRGSPTSNDFIFWISPFDLPETLSILNHQHAQWEKDREGGGGNKRRCPHCCGANSIASSSDVAIVSDVGMCHCAPQPSAEDMALMARVRRILFDGEVLKADT